MLISSCSALQGLLLVAGLHFFSANATAQNSAIDTWVTRDDETGEAKSHIQLYEYNGKLYGKITKLLRPSLAHNCDECEDYRKGQPILGMVIIENMEYSDGMWSKGKVLYPKQGKWYGLKFWLKEGDANTLVVRGNVGPFYRTQYWTRLQK
jgi:uncharacterized protein (DUF2147 family)